MPQMKSFKSFLPQVALPILGALIALTCTACSSNGVSRALIAQACNDSYQVTADYLKEMEANVMANGTSDITPRIRSEYEQLAAEWKMLAVKNSKYEPIYEMYKSRESNGTPSDSQSNLFSEICPLNG